MLATTLLFFITAFFYASVGFGGGSTYTALLVIFNTPYLLIPILALLCNIIVVTGGTWRFHRERLIPWQETWPLFVTSVPMAWFGGSLPINQSTFLIVLAMTLLASGFVMLLRTKTTGHHSSTQRSVWYITGLGAGLGFLAGMVGIGGGIFLAPALHFLNWNTSKVIAGVCSSFILVNSIAGLVGHYSKFDEAAQSTSVLSHWPLFLAVLVGGQLGSIMGIKKFKAEHIKMLTALLVLFVGARLLVNTWLGS